MTIFNASAVRAHWRDYLELTKPRVVALMILTSVIGMLLAVPGLVPFDILILGNLGIALCAGSAATYAASIRCTTRIHSRTSNHTCGS